MEGCTFSNVGIIMSESSLLATLPSVAILEEVDCCCLPVTNDGGDRRKRDDADAAGWTTSIRRAGPTSRSVVVRAAPEASMSKGRPLAVNLRCWLAMVVVLLFGVGEHKNEKQLEVSQRAAKGIVKR